MLCTWKHPPNVHGWNDEGPWWRLVTLSVRHKICIASCCTHLIRVRCEWRPPRLSHRSCPPTPAWTHSSIPSPWRCPTWPGPGRCPAAPPGRRSRSARRRSVLERWTRSWSVGSAQRNTSCESCPGLPPYRHIRRRRQHLRKCATQHTLSTELFHLKCNQRSQNRHNTSCLACAEQNGEWVLWKPFKSSQSTVGKETTWVMVPWERLTDWWISPERKANTSPLRHRRHCLLSFPESREARPPTHTDVPPGARQRWPQATPAARQAANTHRVLSITWQWWG